MRISQDQYAPPENLLPPLPLLELRRLVCHDDSLFQLREDGAVVFPYLGDECWYQSVFDFGCGCGRIARQLLVQHPRPKRYVGIDINPPMIEWCQQHLSPLDSGFQFFHHDVWNLGLGPDNTRQVTAPFPVESEAFTLIIGNQWELHLGKRNGDEEDGFPTDLGTRLMMFGTGAGTEAPPVEPRLSTSDTVVAKPAPSADVGRIKAPVTSRHLLRFSSKLNDNEVQQCIAELPRWYHRFYFDNGVSVRGDYDVEADVADYGFPESMEGLCVLDVGTGAGWFAFYFEQQGAVVTTVDARGYRDFDVYGRYNYPSIGRERREPDRLDQDGRPVHFSPVSRGFWIMKDLLGSAVRFRNSRVYDLSPSLFGGEKFDLVFLGAILRHLRDPIRALIAVRSVCRHRVMASTPVVLGEQEADVLPRQYLPYTYPDKLSWWLPNEACFGHWFLAAGFIAIDVGRQVTLRPDVARTEAGKAVNRYQTLRIGFAFVP